MCSLRQVHRPAPRSAKRCVRALPSPLHAALLGARRACARRSGLRLLVLPKSPRSLAHEVRGDLRNPARVLTVGGRTSSSVLEACAIASILAGSPSRSTERSCSTSRTFMSIQTLPPSSDERSRSAAASSSASNCQNVTHAKHFAGSRTVRPKPPVTLVVFVSDDDEPADASSEGPNLERPSRVARTPLQLRSRQASTP